MDIQWSLLFFSLLAGTGGSILAYVGVSQFKGFGEKPKRNLLIGALVLIIIGGLCSVLHLEQKANIMAAAANIFSFSPISMELIMVGITVILSIVYLVAVIREAGELSLKVIAVLSIIFGLLLGYVTGSGYQMGAQPLWNTVILPLAYLATDLALAGAIYVFALWLSKNSKKSDKAKDSDESSDAKKDAEASVDAEKSDAAKEDAAKVAEVKQDEPANENEKLPLMLMFASSLASLVLCLVYGIITMFGGQPLLFWLGVIVLGSLCNAVCSYLLMKKKVEPTLMGLNIAFALIAGICLRAYMWLIGTGTLDFFNMAQMHMHF